MHGSIWMLCRCVTLGAVDRTSVSSLAEAAIDTGARYPFERGKLLVWGRDKGLID